MALTTFGSPIIRCVFVSVRGRGFARAGGRVGLLCSVYFASTGVKSRVISSLGSGACWFLFALKIGGIGGLRFEFAVRLGCGGFCFVIVVSVRGRAFALGSPTIS